jgi:serine/threonine-protein kinase
MSSLGSEPLEGLPQIGQMVAGKYRLERVLGVGGMGVVVQALHTALDEKVAIKFLSGADASDPERLTRFTREAWAAAKIKNEHVARVSDVAQLDDGTAYLVMDYLEGADLDAVIEQGTLSPETAVDYVLQAAEALAEAHKLGIVHRDLKPGNLFLTHRADGSACIKVLDFGISKFTLASGMTQPASMMGSPHYMAPEQILSAKHVDARVDVWALGVILYELVAGRPPFDGETLAQVIERVLGGNARPLREAVPQISAELEAAVMRSMAPTADGRYADLADFATALAGHGSVSAQGSARFIHGVLRGVRAPASPDPAASTASVAVRVDGASGTEPTMASEVMPRHCAATTAPVTAALSPGEGKLGWVLAASAGAAALLGLGIAAIVWLGADGAASPAGREVVDGTSEPATAPTVSAAPSDPASPSAVADPSTSAATAGGSTAAAIPTASDTAVPTATTRAPSRTDEVPPTAASRPPAPRPTPTKESWNPWKDR